jgi:hypothetical protein
MIKHLVIGYAQDAVANPFEIKRSDMVFLKLKIRRMGGSIHFHNEAGSVAAKINDVMFQSNLSAEMRIVQHDLTPEMKAQFVFSRGHRVACVAGEMR